MYRCGQIISLFRTMVKGEMPREADLWPRGARRCSGADDCMDITVLYGSNFSMPAHLRGLDHLFTFCSCSSRRPGRPPGPGPRWRETLLILYDLIRAMLCRPLLPPKLIRFSPKRSNMMMVLSNHWCRSAQRCIHHSISWKSQVKIIPTSYCGINRSCWNMTSRMK